jgi:uncharacterized protein YprB with RNaseH-like and TPR domain
MALEDCCVLDVETSGGSMNNIPVGFNLLVTGTLQRDVHGVYTSEPESLDQLRELLRSCTGPVVTFNGAHFDLPMLDHWFRGVLGKPLEIVFHYDLMAEIVRVTGRRISLDRICQYTFGEEKLTWDFRDNARVWRDEPHRLIDYNRVDVDLTHELFRRVLRGQHLFLGDASIVLPVPS